MLTQTLFVILYLQNDKFAKNKSRVNCYIITKEKQTFRII